MKFEKPSSKAKYKFCIPIAAVIIVVVCMCCLTPDEKFRLNPEPEVPYMSMAADDFIWENSISAGFLLPTKNNVSYSASMPKLQCNIEISEIGNITVPGVGEKQRIISSIDLGANVMPNSILHSLHLSRTQSLAGVSKSITSGAYFEDISRGTKYATEQLKKYPSNVSIIFCGENMGFCSPSEFTGIISDTKWISDSDFRSIKFLRVKNFTREYPQNFY
jgi:hypothetical protein